MKEIYKELEKIKEFAEKLGYTIGPCTLEEDDPFIRLKLEIIKRRENGTENTSSSD